MAAIVSLTPLISRLAAAFDGVRSSTSRATISAPRVSPTKRIPSGPMASAPADLRSTLPACKPAAKVRAVAQNRPAAVFNVVLIETLQNGIGPMLSQQGVRRGRGSPTTYRGVLE